MPIIPVGFTRRPPVVFTSVRVAALARALVAALACALVAGLACAPIVAVTLVPFALLSIAPPVSAGPLAGSAGSEVRPREPLDAGQLQLALRKLRVLGSALYIAAHPDDENTAFLSYLSSGRLVRAGYMSLTRGDGGQNLIGIETGEQLGVIRTQELLAARRIDGAEQYFSRALDFGFSKSPDETMQIWGHDAILADVVWVIRNFRPDVIVTRFPTDGSGGHGHHTASALLAEEAFRAAADSTRFPEQLALVRPWQAQRIDWNVFRFDAAKADTSVPRVTLDLGEYNALLGRAYTEIAGESRSQHKSQGFGAPERRGSIPNVFELRLGAPARTDLFEGVDLTWSRVQGGAAVDRVLARAEQEFRPESPERVIPLLLEAHAALGKLGATSDDPWVEIKRKEIAEVIRSCAGLWFEAIAERPSASPGATVRVSLGVLNRSNFALTLERIDLPNGAVATLTVPPADSTRSSREDARERVLATNRALAAEALVNLPRDFEYSQPYWLRSPATKGRFDVRDLPLIGRAENPPALAARFVIRAGEERLVFERPVVYRWTDPVAGERYRPFEVVPPVTLKLDHGAYVFPTRDPRTVRVTVQSADVDAGSQMSGDVKLALPAGWRAVPASFPVALGANAERTVTFTVTPPAAAVPSAAPPVLAATFAAAGRTYDRRLVRIDYGHIPIQMLFPRAEAKLVRADITVLSHEVGYVMGSGDQGPDALTQLGCRVTLLSDDELESENLARFDAIVVGVRAYNTRPRLRALQPRLMEFVNGGGTLVTQYQTADAKLDKLGPFPFTISRDRVTVEEAPVRFVTPKHPLLARPNVISATDFEGWVQERGLYFANPYDARYQTVLSANDPGEPARDGGLLYARYGKGVFVYSGYAWFRQLPAGVAGAYRLFANLVSAGR